MSASLRIGRLFGIQIRIHIALILYGLFVAVKPVLQGGTRSAMAALTFLGGLFLFVLVHELAHSLMAKFYAARVSTITLHPFGGLAEVDDRLPSDKLIIVALAGPLSNMLIMMVLLAVAWNVPGGAGLMQSSLFVTAIRVNFMLAAFNLLPIFPLDGGQIVREFILQRGRSAGHLRSALQLSLALALALTAWGLVSQNIFPFVIGSFCLHVNWREYRRLPPATPRRARAGKRSVRFPRPWQSTLDRRWLRAHEAAVSRVVQKTFEEGYESLSEAERRLISRYHSIRERLET